MHRLLGQVFAVIKHLTAGRLQDTADQIKKGRFSSAVGSDDGVQRLTAN